ncbi:MAG: peptidase [Mastigocoleus sp.]
MLVILSNWHSYASWKNNYPENVNNLFSNDLQIALIPQQEQLKQEAKTQQLQKILQKFTKKKLYQNRFENNQISLSLESLPKPKLHPLPKKLADWKDTNNSGDYFSQIQPTKFGHLIWSQFPIKVYIDTENIARNNLAQFWEKTVLNAIQEWNIYLPLEIVNQANIADIQILRKSPPLQFSRDGKLQRARSAQTNFNLYIDKSAGKHDKYILRHRFKILLSPTQSGKYLLPAARHEIGHALGIWGHSPLESDALYFSQVRNPPPISSRDLNTLKLVYQQPTSLGWSLEK